MPSVKQALERRNNVSAILRAICNAGQTTRRELSKNLSLSWGCVSELVTMLIAEKVIVEDEKAVCTAKGRCPVMLSLSREVAVLGIDINRTGITACVCNLYEQTIWENTEPLDTSDKESVLCQLFCLIERLRSQFPNIAVISLAMQGVRDRAAGCWRFPSEKTAFIDFEKDIAYHLDIPTIIEHDPNCMLYGHIDNTESNSKLLVRIDHEIGAALYKYNRFFDDSLLELGYLVVGETGQTLSQLLNTPDNYSNLGQQLGVTLANFSNMIALDEIILCGDFVRQNADLLPVIMLHYDRYVIDVAKATITTANIPNAAFGAAKLAIEQFPYVRKTKEA